MEQNETKKNLKTNKTKKGAKEHFYDRIPLTTKQLDIIILVLIALFVVFFVIGVLKGNGVI